MAQQTTLLDPEAVNRAEALGLHARFVVEGFMSGEHKSPFRGFAIEFTQHREYVPGDDIRHLDWKVLGRTDRYYLKQYEMETNFVAHILLDGSESMNYGSGSITKLHYSKMLGACLAYMILQQRDAVALQVYDEIVRQNIPRTGSLGAIHSILTVLAGFQATQKTNTGQLLHDLAGQFRRRGIVILISDLLDDEEKILDGIQHLRFGGHEVIVFHVMDPFELEFPFKGVVEFEGLEGLPKLKTSPAEIRKTYLKELQTYLDRVQGGCLKQNCHYSLVNTSHPLPEALSAYLNFRHKTSAR